MAPFTEEREPGQMYSLTALVCHRGSYGGGALLY
eukprot:COSAG04_NODE_24968_length_314_cov_0.706977_2_plen_33_part_01